ncbi:MAG: lysylphosphatidylglycerol synthase transmembrane domain-containing protein [Hyphomicrobiales bacterium]
MTVALLVLLVRVVDLRETWSILASASPALVLLGISLSVCDRALMFGKWFPLLRARVPEAPLFPALRVYLASGLAQYLLPVTVGADMLRATAVGRSRNAVAEVGASIVVERLLGTLAAGVMCIVAFAIAVREDLPVRFLIPWAAASVVIGALALVLPFTRLGVGLMRRAAEGLPEGGWVRFLRRLTQGYVAYRNRPALLVWVGLLSLVEQCFPLAIMGIVGVALGSPLSLSALFVTMPLTLFVSRLPVSIAGIGVGEAAIVYLLGLFSVPTADALAIALLCRAIDLPIMTLPGIALWRELVHAPEPAA